MRNPDPTPKKFEFSRAQMLLGLPLLVLTAIGIGFVLASQIPTVL